MLTAISFPALRGKGMCERKIQDSGYKASYCIAGFVQFTQSLKYNSYRNMIHTRSIAFKKMFFAVRGAPSRATACLSLAREGAPRTSAKNSFS
jgi:hypothetical protein